MVANRETQFIVNVSEKPEDISLKVGNSDINLVEAKSLEEFEAGTNMYYFDESPNLNKYATEGSDFESVEIKTTPKLYIKAEQTDVTKNNVELTINDFINTQEIGKDVVNENLSVPSGFNAPNDQITPDSIKLVWDEVEGAETYDVEIDGVIFKNINSNEYTNKELNFDTEYTYRVRSVNKEGYSEWSDAVVARTALDPHRNVPKNMEVIWNDGHYSNEVPALSIDNNDSTQSHSADSAIDKPFILDMKQAYSLEKLEMIFRKNGNGSVKRAEIYSSLDGKNYELLYSNAKETGNPAWATDGEPKDLNFKEPIQARYFKIIVKESVGNFMALREIRPYKVDGTNGKVVGDWNNSGAIDDGDLVFLENYNGLKESDADWGYVSSADLNLNGMIDAYDISYVARQLEDGVTETQDKMAGEIMLVPSKSNVKANEEFTVDVVGLGLSDINALSLELPIDSNKFEIIEAPSSTELTAAMKNLSKLRVHSDGKQDLYITFANIGESTKISGTGNLAQIKIKAKQDVSLELQPTHAMVVDSKLNSKNAALNKVDIDTELPIFTDASSKIEKSEFKILGDESQLQVGMGLDRLVDGTKDSSDSSRMDLKWIFNSDQEDKGTLPFDMTFEFNEPKKFDKFTIYNRVNGDGSINTAALKKVKAVGYLNGEATDLGEINNIDTATTVYDLQGQTFDKIVITALESHKDINTLAINEIEFHEKKGAEVEGIEFVENTVVELGKNEITQVLANVIPSNANNPYYRIKSENTDVLDVIRIDNEKEVKYYLYGKAPGKTNIIATTADGKFSVTQEIFVDKDNIVEKPEVKPEKVGDLKATETTAEKIKLEWLEPENAKVTGYTVYKDGKEFMKTQSTEIVIDGLKENTIYGFKVIANGVNDLKSKPASITVRTEKIENKQKGIIESVKGLFN